MRPNSPFLLAIRILEKANTDFTDILNLIFFKIVFSDPFCVSFGKKRFFLYEYLTQALHPSESSSSGFHLVKDSQRIIPCYTYSLSQLVFLYLFDHSSTSLDKRTLSDDISQFFNEIKKSGKASLFSYLIYIRFLKANGSLDELRTLESEMLSNEWCEKMKAISALSDKLPDDNSELIANIHYFLQYVMEISLPNSYKFHYKMCGLDSLFIPMSPIDARDIIFVSTYSKFKLWSDVYRIFSKAKSEGRLDVPVSGFVKSPIFHFSFSSIIFKYVISLISWNEAFSYLQFPSPLLSREGCKLIYSNLYLNLFNLLIANDKFLLIQSIVSIPRSVFIQDEYVLINALSALASYSGRGQLITPNRILFYKLLSNRLDIDVTCEASSVPPSEFAGIVQAIDPQLSTFLHFIELHKLTLRPSNYTNILLAMLRRRRYDLVSQVYSYIPLSYKQDYYPQFIFLISALRNKDYERVKQIMNEKSKLFTIPEEDLLRKYISKEDVASIFPSSTSSVVALDRWRADNLVTDQEYSSSLSICSTYSLETLFYLRRFISIHHQQLQPQSCIDIHRPQLNVAVRFPDSVIRLASIPSYLLEYEMKHFPFKKKQTSGEADEPALKSYSIAFSDDSVLEDLIRDPDALHV